MTIDELRQIRRKISEIEVRSADGARVRAEALTILFNAEQAAHPVNCLMRALPGWTCGQ